MIADLRYCLRLLPAAFFCGVLVATHAADAQQIQRPNPSTAFVPALPRPEAADNTLGMALLGAVINVDGTVGLSSGLTSASRPITGLYILNFDRDIMNCAYSAVPMAALEQVVPRIIARSGTQIQFNLNKNTDNNLANGQFSVIVFCPR